LGVSVPERTTDKGRVVPALKLRYSSVSVHPMTGHYYLLSAVDRTLLVVDRAGKLIALEQLDEELLPKPEGITFLTNGDLVLSSEGKGGTPVIVRYAYLLN
ncbi:MAG TPA: SdiA-regulated domain-containing protein, partial [Flavobacteriales bacterium]|nr:SdiA-regulated domain-containing protein [Flavobacteriales bacterium]